jgi:hypothetical protein
LSNVIDFLGSSEAWTGWHYRFGRGCRRHPAHRRWGWRYIFVIDQLPAGLVQ